MKKIKFRDKKKRWNKERGRKKKQIKIILQTSRKKLAREREKKND